MKKASDLFGDVKLEDLPNEKINLKYYSEKLIKNYSCQVEMFLRHFKNEYTEPSKINKQ